MMQVLFLQCAFKKKKVNRSVVQNCISQYSLSKAVLHHRIFSQCAEHVTKTGFHIIGVSHKFLTGIDRMFLY